VVCRTEDDFWGAAYVDNFAVGGASEEVVNRKLNELVDCFRGLGLAVHEMSPPVGVPLLWGLSFGTPHSLSRSAACGV
jgi:hypothetical protein